MGVNLARLLVALGSVTVFAGVSAVAGYGWGLIVLGVQVIAFGLALIDIDADEDRRRP